jgi:hypothetical protein
MRRRKRWMVRGLRRCTTEGSEGANQSEEEPTLCEQLKAQATQEVSIALRDAPPAVIRAILLRILRLRLLQFSGARIGEFG